jgi:hypothetical protein
MRESKKKNPHDGTSCWRGLDSARQYVWYVYYKYITADPLCTNRHGYLYLYYTITCFILSSTSTNDTNA